MTVAVFVMTLIWFAPQKHGNGHNRPGMQWVPSRIHWHLVWIEGFTAARTRRQFRIVVLALLLDSGLALLPWLWSRGTAAV
jgi:hypothetical protein